MLRRLGKVWHLRESVPRFALVEPGVRANVAPDLTQGTVTTTRQFVNAITVIIAECFHQLAQKLGLLVQM
jgi:hypothetical protein